MKLKYFSSRAHFNILGEVKGDLDYLVIFICNLNIASNKKKSIYSPLAYRKESLQLLEIPIFLYFLYFFSFIPLTFNQHGVYLPALCSSQIISHRIFLIVRRLRPSFLLTGSLMWSERTLFPPFMTPLRRNNWTCVFLLLFHSHPLTSSSYSFIF